MRHLFPLALKAVVRCELVIGCITFRLQVTGVVSKVATTCCLPVHHSPRKMHWCSFFQCCWQLPTPQLAKAAKTDWSECLSQCWGSSRSVPRELQAGSLAPDLQHHILVLRHEPNFDIDQNRSKTKQICTGCSFSVAFWSTANRNQCPFNRPYFKKGWAIEKKL